MHSDALSLAFAALADPTRRPILARLAEGGATVNRYQRIGAERYGPLDAYLVELPEEEKTRERKS